MEASSLERAFFSAMQRLRRLHMIDVLGTMPRAEFFVLDVLARHRTFSPRAKGMYVSELAMQAHVSPQSVSRTLRAMEEKGYIAREIDPSNRRNVFIRLTPEGVAAWEAKHRAMHTYIDRVMDAMGEDDMRSLIALLGRLADTIEAVAASPQVEESHSSQ